MQAGAVSKRHGAFKIQRNSGEIRVWTDRVAGYRTQVASEWSREHELRDASREFVASEWKREAALRASTQKFLERDDVAIAEAVASTRQFLERDDVAVAEAVAQVVCAAAIVPPLVLLAPLLVPLSVARRKDVWNRATRQSRADHVAAFDAAVDAYCAARNT